MNELLSILELIFVFGIIPLAFCIIVFRWFINLSKRFSLGKSLVVISIMSGISFLAFQLVQSLIVILISAVIAKVTGNNRPFNPFYELYDLVFGLGLIRSWIGLTRNWSFGALLDQWKFKNLWEVELIYILFYTIIGLVTAFGAKLWNKELIVKIPGFVILLTTFLIYAFWIYFWMIYAMYL